jgi:hypothetical protein
MRPLSRRIDASDLEFQPVALFEIVNTAIEGEQEFKRVILRNSILRLVIVS